MRRLLPLLAILPLAACATAPHPDDLRPSLTTSLPMSASPDATSTSVESRLMRQDAPEAEGSTLPIGVGFTIDPGTVMIAAAYDVPVDANLSAGPAMQFGFDDDVTIFAPYLKLKYKLPGVMEDESGRPTFKPYVTVGVGAAIIDKSGRSSDSGLLVNGGAGVRFLTGESYRLGSEALINWMPGRTAGERAYFSWELLQLSLQF